MVDVGKLFFDLCIPEEARNNRYDRRRKRRGKKREKRKKISSMDIVGKKRRKYDRVNGEERERDDEEEFSWK